MGSSIVAGIQKTQKFEIYNLSRNIAENSDSEQKDSEIKIQCDISDYQTLKKIEELENLEVLIHTAGMAHQFGKVSKVDFWRTNVQGTENICRLARILKVRHLILISSVSVYGDHGEFEIDETFPCQPVGFYAESKLEAEKTAISICEKSGIRLTILRLGTVIGEGDIGNVSRLITLIDKNRFFWIGTGRNKKSLIYKKDIAECILNLLESKKNNKTEIYNLTAEAVSMKDTVCMISDNLKKKPIPLKMPEQILSKIFQLNEKTFSIKVLKKFENIVKKWLSNDIFSGKNLYANYGFKPQTPISEAIKRQVVNYSVEKNNLK